MGDFFQPLKATPEMTLADLLLRRIECDPDGAAYRQYSSQSGWSCFNWRDVGAQVSRWRQALLASGLQPGDRVAVMLHNCLDWVLFDQAALGLGLVVVPIYMGDRPENIAYVINDSASRLLLLDSLQEWQAVEATGHLQVESLTVVVRNDVETADRPHKVVALRQWLEQGGVNVHPAVGTDAWPAVIPEQLATIVYTSGTTGRPKGVMLTHANILSNLVAAVELVQLRTSDTLLSFLPLSHMLERTAGYYMPIFTGAEVAFARSIDLLTEDFQQIQPTVVISVPRIFERVEQAVQSRIAGRARLVGRLFELTVKVGWQQFEYQQQRGQKPALAFLLPLLLRLFAKPVLAALGGRLRFAVCGGAPLPPQVSRTFIALGLPLLQGYGLTETSPAISLAVLNDNRPDSVGSLLPGVEVKIAADDEIICRGANVMAGYWRNQEATDAVLDSEGWFHTGDCGRLDGKHLYITGRLKEIIVLANGEKVPPADMEHAICRDPLIEQCMVLGEGRPFLGAIVVTSREELARLTSSAEKEFSAEELREQLLSRIALAIDEFPGYAKIYRITVTDDPWTVDNGLLTPTLKLKRPAVESRFEAEIEQLYAGH